MCEANPERCPNFPKQGGSPNPEFRNLKQRLDNRGPGSLNSGPQKMDSRKLQPGNQFPKPFTPADNELPTTNTQETGESGNTEASGVGF
jgi:hypothetical protein